MKRDTLGRTVRGNGVSATLTAAFEQGRLAYHRNRGINQVPYSDISKARAWERGYEKERERKLRDSGH